MPAQIKFVDKADKEPVIKGTPQVPKEFSKKLSNMDGTHTVYYIHKEWGYRHDLWPKMKFSNTHPADKNFCEITIPIDRI